MLRKLLGTLVLVSGLSVAGHSQTFPPFTSPAILASSSFTPEYATSSASVPNGLYGTVVFTAYASTDGNLPAYGISADGQDYVYSDTLPNLPAVQCSAGFSDLCGIGVANFGGNVYLAYANAAQELVIVEGTVVSGNVGYSFSVLQTYPAGVALTTVPALAVFKGSLQIIFGSSSDSATKNAFYQVTCSTVGAQCTSPDESKLGAGSLKVASGSTPGLAALNGTLFMCSQQNSSGHNLYVYKSTDGTTWDIAIGNGGEDTSLQLGSGAQMVTYNNNLVLANQQNNSNHALFIFSSPDGVNWSAQEYPGIQMGGAPGLTTFGTGIALSFKSNNSSILYGSYAAN